jgi:hypothetical protein
MKQRLLPKLLKKGLGNHLMASIHGALGLNATECRDYLESLSRTILKTPVTFCINQIMGKTIDGHRRELPMR